MGNVFYFNWENDLIIFLQNVLPKALISFFSFITDFGDEIYIVAALGLIYWCINKELGKKMGIYLSFLNVFYPSIKSIAKRKRPYMANDKIQIIKKVSAEGDIYDVTTQGYSFPSGHACNTIGTYGAIVKENLSKVLNVILIILILLVGISRFVLGAHYPTDVLIGWVVGTIIILLIDLLVKKLGRNTTYIVLLAVGVPGFFYASANDFYTGYGMLLGIVLGIFFEEKYVNFKESKNVLECIIRVLIGGGLFFGLNTLLKMPFSTEFLEGGTKLSFIVRTVRYAITCFVLFGAYPLLFKYLNKLFKK